VVAAIPASVPHGKLASHEEDVCFWHKADVHPSTQGVRFVRRNGRGEAGDISSGETLASESRREAYLFPPCAGLLLRHRDVRGVLVLHADHVVAGVDMQDLAGDATAEVGEEVERAAADVLDRHGAA
jgi:hypothetical protein